MIYCKHLQYILGRKKVKQITNTMIEKGNFI